MKKIEVHKGNEFYTISVKDIIIFIYLYSEKQITKEWDIITIHIELLDGLVKSMEIHIDGEGSYNDEEISILEYAMPLIHLTFNNYSLEIANFPREDDMDNFVVCQLIMYRNKTIKLGYLGRREIEFPSGEVVLEL